jgi:hypothetical protein
MGGAALGSSGWSYTVPYQPDVAAALEQLRQDVYLRGEYYHQPLDHTVAMSEEEFEATLNPRDEESGVNDTLREDWQAAQRHPKPTSPDTLLASQPVSGTHSIIDIYRGISTAPAAFTASPLTADELVGFFGTSAPTTQQLRDWLRRSAGGVRESWIGTYVVTYLDGKPAEIHFFGSSGD